MHKENWWLMLFIIATDSVITVASTANGYSVCLDILFW